MYLPTHSLLYIASIILTSPALAQDDPPAIVPPGSQAQMYPPYTYIPSVFAAYKPHPHGLPFLNPNTTINPTSPHPHNPPPSAPPSLPPLTPSNPQFYWYSQITHNGISPFIANGTSWKVYHNVHDYGALGDGIHDDAAAIQAAINDGGRGPGGNGKGTTGAPAVLYFPPGTYNMGSPIQLYVDTVLLGDPIARPTLKASTNYTGSYVWQGPRPRFYHKLLCRHQEFGSGLHCREPGHGLHPPGLVRLTGHPAHKYSVPHASWIEPHRRVNPRGRLRHVHGEPGFRGRRRGHQPQ